MLLAKLLATENISITYRKALTASCDLENRILYLPILKEKVSEGMKLLFAAHEVGHFLYTDFDKWKSALEIYNKNVINVVEDSRIERKIQKYYPGLVKDFISGYNELNQIDFFGIANIDINSLNFIDRLNLYCKLGPMLMIKFSPKEQELVNEVISTETWEDVIEVVKKIYSHIKEEISKEKQEITVETLDSDEDTNEDDTYHTESITQESATEKFNDLIDENSFEHVYIDIERVNSEDFILNYKDLITISENHFSDRNAIVDKNFPVYNKFYTENKSAINHLISEFTLKKNAKQLRKLKINKTGLLNEKKLFKYQISDNIFRSSVITNKGLSHGLVFFIDWSGSMANNLEETIKQMMLLVIFSRKLKIPFEVYAFSDICSHYLPITKKIKYTKNFKEGLFITPQNMCLLNLLSSNMNDNDFKYMCSILLGTSFKDYSVPDIILNKNSNYYPTPRFLNLGKTPLSEAVILAMDILPKFKNKHKLDKVHNMFLTDGDTTDTFVLFKEDNPIKLGSLYQNIGTYKIRSIDDRYNPQYKIYLRNNTTKIIKPINKGHLRLQITISLLEMLKDEIEGNSIGFRIIGNELHRLTHHFSDNVDTLKKQLNSNKFTEVNSSFYDKYFFLKKYKSDSDELTLSDDMSMKKMCGAFIKSIKRNETNKIFLSQFISAII